jgi:hypothetical protein
MLYKGLQIIICAAVRQADIALFTRYCDALILGAVREDIAYLRPQKRIWEHLSFTHFSGRWLSGGFIPFFTPSAARCAQHYFDHACKLAAQQKIAAAMVQLGRASHLLIDMACPVHVHRVAHWHDGYEWYIEVHGDDLAMLQAAIPTAYQSAAEIVEGLARFTRQFPADGTHHHLGRWLKARGWRRSHTHTEIAQQAEQIIPVASAHLAAMYLLFVQKNQTIV